MEQAKASARRSDAMTNRTRVLEAAQAVFAERGLDLEMGEVAARAHLGVGTLYGHFANREDLLRAIVERAVDDALGQWRAALEGTSADPRGALEALVFAGLSVQQQYASLFAVIRDHRLAKLLDPSYGPTTRNRFLAIPQELIEHGLQAGLFRSDLDPEMAAITLIGALSGASDLLGIDGSLHELTRRLSHHLLMLFSARDA